MGNQGSQGTTTAPAGTMDLAHVPPGTMIALKAWNGRYMTADVRDAAVCSVDTPGPAAQQRFTIIKAASDNRFFLRSCFGTHLSINVLGYVGFHNSMGGCEEFNVVYDNGQPVFKGYSSGRYLWINNDGSASGRNHIEDKAHLSVEMVGPIPPGSPMAMQLQRAVQMRIRYAQLDDKEDAAWAASGTLGGMTSGTSEVGDAMAHMGQAGATWRALDVAADATAVYNQNIADIMATPIDTTTSMILPVAHATVFNGIAIPTSAPPPPSYTAPQPLPPGWRELKTPDGQMYYADDKTGTTSWTRP